MRWGAGDDTAAVARQFGISVEDLIWFNPKPDVFSSE